MQLCTKATVTDRDLLREAVAEARERGWTEEHGEFDAGSTCFGAPVFDQSGPVTAAISIAGMLLSQPARPMNPSRRSPCMTVSTESQISSREGSE